MLRLAPSLTERPGCQLGPGNDCEEVTEHTDWDSHYGFFDKVHTHHPFLLKSQTAWVIQFYRQTQKSSMDKCLTGGVEMIVNQITQQCVKKGITIAKLERETGISNGTIGKWGRSSPTVEKLEKVADYFGVSLDYLVGRTAG